MAADENGGGGLTLQVRLAASLAAAGPLQCRYTRPPFNGAAAVKCFFLSSSFLFSSCVVLNKNKKYYRVAMSIHIFFYIGIADAGLEVVEKRFDQSFAFP